MRSVIKKLFILKGPAVPVKDALSQNFSKVPVSREKLKQANSMLSKKNVKSWDEEFANDTVQGIEKDKIGEFANSVVDNLTFMCDSAKNNVKSKILSMAYAAERIADVEKVSFHFDNWKSLYGFLVASKDEKDAISVAYCFSSLEFKIEKDIWIFTLLRRRVDRLSKDQIQDIKDVFCKHHLLEHLKAKGVISEINYID